MSDSPEGPANAEERRRWNDPEWAAKWLDREQVTEAVADGLLAHAQPSSGDRILEVGSGGGRTSLALARLTRPGGVVVGIDISEALVGVARQRAEEAGVRNVTFLAGDAQEEVVPGAPFTMAVSQFGTMFFDEPVRAFANLRRMVVPGGRLVFVCWQEMERNPWHVGHVLAPFLPPATPPPPGKAATGPFVLGDAAATVRLLESAGWKNVRRTGYDRTVTVQRKALADDARPAQLGIAEEDLERARVAVHRHVESFRDRDGSYRIPLAFQVLEASSAR